MDSRLLAVNHYVIVYVKIENVKIKKKKRGQEVEFLEMYSWRIHYTILYSLLSRDHEDCWNSAMGGGGATGIVMNVISILLYGHTCGVKHFDMQGWKA